MKRSSRWSYLCFNRVCSVELIMHFLCACSVDQDLCMGNLSHHGNICTKACGAVGRFTFSGLLKWSMVSIWFWCHHAPLVPWHYMILFECMADTNFNILSSATYDFSGWLVVPFKAAFHNLIHCMFLWVFE